MSNGESFLSTALSHEVLPTAIRVSMVVGTILALINHGPNLLQGSLSGQHFIQIGLTYLVPYSVSTYSAVKIIQQRRSDRAAQG